MYTSITQSLPLIPVFVSVWDHNSTSPLFICLRQVFLLSTHTDSFCPSFSFPLRDAPPHFILEPAVKPEAEWMALCDWLSLRAQKVCVSPPSPVSATLTTRWHDGPNNSEHCCDITQKVVQWAPPSGCGVRRTKCRAALPLTKQPGAEVWESADAVTQLIWLTCMHAVVAAHCLSVCCPWKEPGCKSSFKAVCADVPTQKKSRRVCVHQWIWRC